MRIAMVSEHASPLAVLGGVDAGGQNVHVACLAAALGSRGHEVVVYTRRDAEDLAPRVTFSQNVTVEHIDAGPALPISKDRLLVWMGAFASGLRVAWRRQPPDLVHSHFWMSAYAALEARQGFGLPLVHTFHALGSVRRRHQGSMDGSPVERLPLEARIAEEAELIVCTSRDEVRELRRMGTEADKLCVVPCGVDLALFRPDGHRAPRRGDVGRVVVVSRLVPRKGIDDVIRAMVAVPDAELLIAGGPSRVGLADDGEAARLMSLIDALDLRGRARLIGAVRRDQVPALLRSAEVAVSTPWYEPFGIVPVEAMACGVPMIGSAVGGILDTVVHDVTGLHVPPKNPEAIAAGIGLLLDEPARREAYGRAGTQRAEARYGWDRIATATLDAYERLLRGTRAAALDEGATEAGSGWRRGVVHG